LKAQLSLRGQWWAGNTGFGVAWTRTATLGACLVALVIVGCGAAGSTSKSLNGPASTNAKSLPEPIAPTALMDPGDEIDDNIWVRRPRNRLQPGQTSAPDPAERIAASRREGVSEVPAVRDAGAAPARADTAAPSATSSGLADLGDNTNRAVPIKSGAETPRSIARAPANESAESARPAAAAPTKSPPEDGGPPQRSGTVAAGNPVWSIALATFSGDEHRATAESAANQFVQQIPELRGAFVRSRSSGSVIMWGEFDGPRDARAKPALDRLKQVEFGGGRPFARAMLARLEQFSEEEMGPWDLRQVRRRHPSVRVIYTLQVAAWSDLGSGTMKFEQIRRSAEDYCRQLRGQGQEAWFHHDADQLTSIVTIGVFGSKAYDPQSTLYAPEVEDLRRRFPSSLLNGEELRIRSDPLRPEVTTPQPSRLVEVPR